MRPLGLFLLHFVNNGVLLYNKDMSIGDFWGKLMKKKAQDIRVAIDIGSMSVKTILFEKKGENLIIIKKMVTQFPLREDTVSIVKFINTYIREELFQIIKDIRRVPDKVIIGIAGDFMENKISSIKIERAHKNRKVSEEEITEVFKKGVEAVNAENSDAVLIDSFPMRVLIDGYEIEDVYKDITGDMIEIFVFSSLMKKEYWEQFKLLKRILGGIPLKFVSNQFVNAFSLPKVLNSPQALLIDVGAKATEISYVNNSKIRFIRRFLFGGYNFTKLISESLGVGYVEADNIKRQYEDQILPSSLTNKIKESVLRGVIEWEREFIDILSSDYNFIVPADVFVFGGGLYLKEIQDFLKRGEWAVGLSWREKINISFLSAEKITHNVLDATKLSGFNEVSFLSLVYYSYLLD